MKKIKTFFGSVKVSDNTDEISFLHGVAFGLRSTSTFGLKTVRSYKNKDSREGEK